MPLAEEFPSETFSPPHPVNPAAISTAQKEIKIILLMPAVFITPAPFYFNS
jgi:hypothetical protein